jgi:hypothetical protein
MDNRAVLYVGVVAYPYIMHIPADNRIKPNRAAIAHHHIAYYGSIFGNKAIASPGRAYIFNR